MGKIAQNKQVVAGFVSKLHGSGSKLKDQAFSSPNISYTNYVATSKLKHVAAKLKSTASDLEDNYLKDVARITEMANTIEEADNHAASKIKL